MSVLVLCDNLESKVAESLLAFSDMCSLAILYLWYDFAELSIPIAILMISPEMEIRTIKFSYLHVSPYLAKALNWSENRRIPT